MLYKTDLVDVKKYSFLERHNIRFKQVKILYSFICSCLPQVKKNLGYWEKEALLIDNSEVRKQAFSSLRNKAFHCQGGSVFAVPYKQARKELLNLIVAYQTLCDFLDNLCDRANCVDGQAFRQLHQSLLDALNPENEITDYYLYYPHKDNSLYINKLVSQCRNALNFLPSYHLVKKDVLQLAEMYISLQVYKHIQLDERETILKTWSQAYLGSYPALLWQEYAAATGSTLAIFALLGLASEKNINRDECNATVKLYFPWICGLHILLDYFIDQEEDRRGKDLNFVSYYDDEKQMLTRLEYFIEQSYRFAQMSAQPYFAKTIIEGLLALYLSDRKVKEQGLTKIANRLLNCGGKSGWNIYRLCKVVRKVM